MSAPTTADADATIAGPDRESGRRRRISLLERADSVGRYLVLRRIGAGGMGAVYAAHDPKLDRKVALKLVWGPKIGEPLSERDRERLLGEAKALARLSHPNVITVHDTGEFGGGIFIAMEFIDGVNLRQWREQEPRSWREVRDVYLAAGEGLAAAHAAGIVHRDFKPDNVMIDAAGTVRVLDFGLAQADGTLLATGDLHRGTPAYMAPEQHSRPEADARSDQFAFCVALHETLYGERPFGGTSSQQAAASIISGRYKPPPPAADVPRWLARAVIRGLAANPESRFSAMDELLVALQQDRERRRLWRIGGVGAVVVAAGAAGFAMRPSSPRCDASAQRVDELWDGERRHEFKRAVEGAGLEVSDEALERILSKVDAYAADLADTVRLTCSASEDAGLDAAVGALRLACLEEHRAGLTATVDGMIAQPQWAVSDPADALALLRPLSECQQAEQHARFSEMLADPRVAALRAELSELEVALKSGTPEAEAKMRAAIERAAGLHAASSVGHARRELGSHLEKSGKNDEAIAIFERVLGDASKTGDGQLVHLVLNDLAYAHVRRGEPRAALVLIPLVRVTIGGSALPPDRRESALRNVEGAAYLALGRFDEAKAAFEDSMRGPDADQIERARQNLGALYFLLGDPAQAEQLYRAALDGVREDVGEENIDYLETQTNLADALAAQGALSEASTLYDTAMRRLDALGLGTSAEYGRTLHHMAEVEFDLGRIDEARRDLGRARAILRERTGARHPYAVSTLTSEIRFALAIDGPGPAGRLAEREASALEIFAGSGPSWGQIEALRGNIALAARDLEQARRRFEASVAAIEPVGVDHITLAPPLAGLIEVALREGDLVGARAFAARGESLVSARTAYPVDVARLRTLIGYVRAADGDVRGAKVMADAAAALLEGSMAHPEAPTALLDPLRADPAAAWAAWRDKVAQPPSAARAGTRPGG